jgi:hypothetical protein
VTETSDIASYLNNASWTGVTQPVVTSTDAEITTQQWVDNGVDIMPGHTEEGPLTLGGGIRIDRSFEIMMESDTLSCQHCIYLLGHYPSGISPKIKSAFRNFSGNFKYLIIMTIEHDEMN